jgi:hypothetical protein
MFLVRCKLCTIVERREKLLVSKFDDLQWHVKHCKVIVVKLGVAMGQHYLNVNS